MNDSLDLRNRIIKMRESNNLTATKTDSFNNNLMSDFENSIKDDTHNKSNFDKDTVDDKKAVSSKSNKINSEDLVYHNDETINRNLNRTMNDNDAQFLMLANKFNEAVEVILELSDRLEKLERNASQNPNIKKNVVNNSSFFNYRWFVFLLIISIIVYGFYNFPFDFLVIKSIFIDILSNL